MTTIADIAKAAGVSSMTVSRILNGHRRYSRAKLAKRAESIRTLAREMGYRQNTGALAMRKGCFDCVSLLLSLDRIWSLLPDSLLEGIQQALSAANLHLTVGSFADRQLTDQENVPKLLRQLSSDGLLINYNARIPERMVELIQSYRLPSIWINSRHASDAVYADDRAAAVDATARLLDLGHRRIAYVSYANRPGEPDEHYSFSDRFAGYQEMMNRAGLSAYRYGNADWRLEGRIVESMRELLRRPDRPTAMICYGEIESRAVQMAAALQGLVLSRDLSLVTFGMKALDDLGPKVATAILPEFQIGLTAVAMLREKIADPQITLPSSVISFRFDPGSTLGAAD